MSRPRKNWNRIQCTIAPTITRFVFGNCERCGQESSYLALCVFRYGTREPFDTPKLTCAKCRLKQDGHWALHPTWQEGANVAPNGENMGGKAWKEWAKNNPPLEEVFED